jgi:primosomal protein N' (replication factor Y)
VPALGRALDYLIPEGLEEARRVGTIVRVQLQGRRVRGWVVEADVAATAGMALKPIAKITGRGPDAGVIDLARWAAHRWAGRPVHLLRTASPERAIRRLPEPSSTMRGKVRARDVEPRLLRRPPGSDPVEIIAPLVGAGTVVVVAPTLHRVQTVAAGLRSQGLSVAVFPREWAQAAAGSDVVIGTRVAVWATVPMLAGIVVLDEHDEALQQEQAPTWHAREVAVERARREGASCVLESPAPSLAALERFSAIAPSRTEEREGWPVVDLIDRRREPPGRLGLFSDRLVPHLRREGRVLCVLNRKGRSRLLACAACGELARCERCAAAVAEIEEGRLDCGQCGTRRPRLCGRCGSQKLKNLRLGVGRAREELEALLREPVGEVTGSSSSRAGERVLVGTEAVLHNFDSAAVVVFLDVDQELVAPRYRAAEQTLALLARAARLLGGRSDGGRLVVQTRMPEHEVLQSVLLADPSRVVGPERARRALLGFPPVTALASVSGPAAEGFVATLSAVDGLEILGPSDGRYLVRAANSDLLADGLAEGERPSGRLRVHVDPARL